MHAYEYAVKLNKPENGINDVSPACCRYTYNSVRRNPVLNKLFSYIRRSDEYTVFINRTLCSVIVRFLIPPFQEQAAIGLTKC